jgi:glyoxylase-like metal-dependent hydrolase (beta-lactamase superfamily II)
MRIGTRLYVIPAGTLRIDKGAVFTPGIDDGVLIEIPVPVYLIRTDNGENVLVDTGMHPAHIDDPSYSFGLEDADTVLARMQPEDQLEPRLAEIGLEIGDITHVVNTHLHPDHCGDAASVHAEDVCSGRFQRLETGLDAHSSCVLRHPARSRRRAASPRPSKPARSFAGDRPGCGDLLAVSGVAAGVRVRGSGACIGRTGTR